MSNHKHTNDLIYETSPYLLQHAHNPVNWQAWHTETLTQARKENKLILISIGYATCHWCHVMEAESFENEAVAKIMNEHFICIKVDREERPDIDQIYMDAVQLLTGRGGWPLHSITLPDGRPFWGGTYYPRDNWMSILTEINRIWQQEPEKILEYAENLTQGIRQKDYVPFQSEIKSIQPHIFTPILQPWKERFDYEWGGMNRPPKFPLPNNYHFLLRIAVQNADAKLLDFVNLTLQKMAFGGIYDHIRGGFARYSTDHKWHVPHFEKMLYDNAQLVSLYCEAYLITENPLYKETVLNTLQFIESELYDDATGGFYSALDADSINPEGVKEEGAFYIWTEKELKEILPSEFDLFARYYHINTLGHWEKGHYVLIKNQSDVDFCFENNLDLETFQELKQTWHSKLRTFQDKRPKPFLDDKILTSWNALMLKGYCDAYRVFNQPNYLEFAQKNIRFLISRMLRPDGGLNRNFNPKNPESKSKINAYLEDYATLIDALISLHEVTLEEKYLHLAKTFTDYTLEHFFDTDTGFFFFTSDEDVELVHRKIDVPDDVIPSGNSIMARNLFKLSHLFNNAHYEKVSRQMLNNVLEHMHTYASSYSNWLFLASDLASEYYEIVISGKDAVTKLKELNTVYIPNKLITGSVENSTMPLMEQRCNSEKTSIFVCVNTSCLLPSEQVLEAIKPIKIQF